MGLPSDTSGGKLSLRQACKDLRGNWRSAEWWKGVYRRRIYSHLLRTDGTYVIDERWDNLVLLDACRYDTFRELNGIQGKLESRISRGSCTVEFLRENFTRHPKRGAFGDIVYVTANPYVDLLLRDRFHRIYPVWDHGWDDDLATVPPKCVVEEALEARAEHPDKRLIVHFMQPHFPSLSGRFPAETGIGGLRSYALNRSEYKEVTVERLLEEGKLTGEEVWSSYKDNLRIVLSHVKNLTEGLLGTTIITSDHGELFGERVGLLYPFREYGHKCGLHVQTLVSVPWFIITNDTRAALRTESSGLETSTYSREGDEKIRDRLRRLGYE
jgi:hypothetical protein